jgi:hypothetical protein
LLSGEGEFVVGEIGIEEMGAEVIGVEVIGIEETGDEEMPAGDTAAGASAPVWPSPGCIVAAVPASITGALWAEGLGILCPCAWTATSLPNCIDRSKQ